MQHRDYGPEGPRLHLFCQANLIMCKILPRGTGFGGIRAKGNARIDDKISMCDLAGNAKETELPKPFKAQRCISES